MLRALRLKKGRFRQGLMIGRNYTRSSMVAVEKRKTNCVIVFDRSGPLRYACDKVGIRHGSRRDYIS